MCENLHQVNELRYLWKHRGNKDYDLESFITDGTSINYIMFKDKRNRQKVLGKIVTNSREGEAYHWPRLQHENLAPLLDTVSINEKTTIYILPKIGLNLKLVIHGEEFMMDPECFNRKRAYAKDILVALDFLHRKSLCVMNLTELIVYVSSVADKAILSDFHCVHLIQTARKEDLELPVLYKAPELKTGHFDPVSAEMWACGVMFLLIFTKDTMPSAFIGEEVQSVLQAVKEINYDIIQETNPGAKITSSMIDELKSFLELFLVESPKRRVSIREASRSTFLKNMRVEVKDDSKREFSAKNSKFEKFRAFSKFKNRKKAFEDLYSKEFAKYKDNLKTNTFINLKYVPNEDDMPKYPEGIKSRKDKENDLIRKKDMEESTVEQPDYFMLKSEQKSKESPVGDTEIGSITPKIAENFKSSNVINQCSTNNSNITKISSSFGDVTKDYIINEINHSIPAFSNIDNLIKASTNEEFFKQAECSSTHCQIRQLSSESFMPLNSLDILNNNKEQASDVHIHLEPVPHNSQNPAYHEEKLNKKSEVICGAENETNDSDFKKISSFEGTTKDDMNYEVYHNVSTQTKIDDTMRSPSDDETFKLTEHSSIQFQTRHSSSESFMSFDSLDIPKTDHEKASDVYVNLESAPPNSEKVANYDDKLDMTNKLICDSRNENNDSNFEKISATLEDMTKDDINNTVHHKVLIFPKVDDAIGLSSDDEILKKSGRSDTSLEVLQLLSDLITSLESLEIPKNNQNQVNSTESKSISHDGEEFGDNDKKLDSKTEQLCGAINRIIEPNKKSGRSDTSLEVHQLLSDLVMSLESLEIPKNNQDQVNNTESKSTSHDVEKFGNNAKKLDLKTEQLCGAINRNKKDPNLEKISRNYGNVIKEDINDRVYHNVSAFPKIDNTTKSALNDETFMQSEYSDTSFEIYSSLSDSVSLDSLEIPLSDQENTYNYTELKSASYESEKFDENDVKLNKNIEELCRSENGTSPCRKVVHVNSVFNIKSALERNLLNKSQSCQSFENRRTYENEKPKDDVSKIIFQNNRSDDAMSYTNSCIVKDDTDNLNLATSVKDDNVDLHFATSVKEDSEKNRQCYENEEKSKSETLISKVNAMEMKIDFQNNISDEEMNIKEELLEERGTLRHEFYFQNDKNDDVKTEANLFSFAEHLKNFENDTISINTFKNKKKTKYSTFRRNYSYEKAIKNGRSDLKINENFTAAKRNNLNTGKRASFLNFPFMNKNISTTKKKVKIDNKVKLEKSKPNVSTLTHQDNNRDSQNTSSVMKEYVSGDSETSPEENKRVKRRKWLKYFLCIGSK